MGEPKCVYTPEVREELNPSLFDLVIALMRAYQEGRRPQEGRGTHSTRSHDAGRKPAGSLPAHVGRDPLPEG